MRNFKKQHLKIYSLYEPHDNVFLSPAVVLDVPENKLTILLVTKDCTTINVNYCSPIDLA